MDIPVSGTKPTSGKLTYKDNQLIGGILTIDDYIVTINGNNVTADKGTSPISIVTTGDGLYASDEIGRYIYRGSNPNNYIWLDENGDGVKANDNSEMYRIISYEDDGTIKVIKNSVIGNMAWDTQNTRKNSNNTYCNSNNGCNVWSNSAKTLYNGVSLGDNFHYEYYNADTDTTKTSTSSGTVNDESSLNIYLNSTWLNSVSGISDNIISHNFSVGAWYSSGPNKPNARHKEEINSYVWNGKIGLMNLIEFKEASTASTCDNLFKLVSGGNCHTENWMFISHDRPVWLLSAYPNGGSNIVWNVFPPGSVGSSYAYGECGVRPAFYLKSSISLEGMGTEDEPYKIVTE